MNRVAKRYAKALFEQAREDDELNKIENDIQNIRSVIENNQDFKTFLASPLVSEDQKSEVLNQVFKDRTQQLTMNFIGLLAQKKRMMILNEIFISFADYVMDYRNQVKAQLISATELTKEQIDEIRKNVQSFIGKEVQLDVQINSKLIGGFVVKVEDKVIDNSIRYRLDTIREHLVAR
ncbi:MAG: ATP synthase F1 subunit delta [Caldithrix sp.]|nr:ATP synthase F1 subunit delta [Caldithrix sp.]